MQRAAASQIAMCAPIFEEAHTPILSIQSEYAASADLYRHNQQDFHEQGPKKNTLRKEKLIARVSEWQRGGFCVPVWVENNNFLLEKRDSYLSDLFDLWASFANQRATLAPWEDQAKCHRWLACHVAVCHRCCNILKGRIENIFWLICQCWLYRNIHSTSLKAQTNNQLARRGEKYTSSNFCAIMENVLKMPSVGPVMVTILSGDDPSDILIRAPLYKTRAHTVSPLIYCNRCV